MRGSGRLHGLVVNVAGGSHVEAYCCRPARTVEIEAVLLKTILLSTPP